MPPLWEQAVSMLFALVMFLLSLNVLFPPPHHPVSSPQKAACLIPLCISDSCSLVQGSAVLGSSVPGQLCAVQNSNTEGE